MRELPDRDDYLDSMMRSLYQLGLVDLAEPMAERIADYVFYHKALITPKELSAEEKADARDIFNGSNQDVKACVHCAGIHHQVSGLGQERQPCPRVKSLKRHTDGVTILEVEYWPNGEWEADVIFPSDAVDDGEGA